MALLLTACGADHVIGVERTLSIVSARARGGRWFEGGFRQARAASETSANLWYGVTDADGALSRVETVDVAGAADALSAAVPFRDGWLLAGTVTGDDGRRVAWLRALDAQLAESWTRTLPGGPGTEREGRALAVTNEGLLLFGGLERRADGVDDGFIAVLEADGALRWQKTFGQDFRFMGVTDFQVFGVGALPPPGSPSRMTFFVSGTRSAARVPAMLYLTLSGDLFGSARLGSMGEAGVAPGVFTDREPTAPFREVSFCVQDGEAPALAWNTDFGFTNMAVVRAAVPAPATVVGCAATATQLFVAGMLRRDSGATPYVAVFDREAHTFSRLLEWSDARATALGLSLDEGGAPVLFGRTEPPLRRWRQAVTP